MSYGRESESKVVTWSVSDRRLNTAMPQDRSVRRPSPNPARERMKDRCRLAFFTNLTFCSPNQPSLFRRVGSQ